MPTLSLLETLLRIYRTIYGFALGFLPTFLLASLVCNFASEEAPPYLVIWGLALTAGILGVIYVHRKQVPLPGRRVYRYPIGRDFEGEDPGT